MHSTTVHLLVAVDLRKQVVVGEVGEQLHDLFEELLHLVVAQLLRRACLQQPVCTVRKD